MTGLKALFCFAAAIMFGGKANIPAFPLGGTLFGVGGKDGDCGTSKTTTTTNKMRDDEYKIIVEKHHHSEGRLFKKQKVAREPVRTLVVLFSA